MYAEFFAAGAILVLSLAFVVPSLADIYRWDDESGVIHFTDDPSTIPAKYRGKTREIQKTPPQPGRPSLSTMGPAPSRSGPTISPRPPIGDTLEQPYPPQDDDATMVEKLRSKIDAKERFIRGVDEKQSLATNPYRNRNVSPSDLELYKKYKEELPADRERLKTLAHSTTPIKEQ